MELRRFLPLYDFYCCSANEGNENYENMIRLYVYFFYPVASGIRDSE